MLPFEIAAPSSSRFCAKRKHNAIRFSLFSEPDSAMTDGEITFHLREIVPHWTLPRITSATGAELERQKLIEFSQDRQTIRLTPDGARRKNAGRVSSAVPGINLVRTRKQKQRTPRRFTAQAKRLM